ncbi:MAG: hypothetical protein R6U32_03145 [Candidatus Woesearchaeota archaeon]
MVINSTLASEPVIQGITSLVNTFKVLVGGVVGLYILMFIWRVYTYKRNRRFFKRIRRDIVKMTSALEETQAEMKGMKRKIDRIEENAQGRKGKSRTASKKKTERKRKTEGKAKSGTGRKRKG